MCKRGFIFREGVIDINLIRKYANKKKVDFLDLRRIGFTNINQLDLLLSRYLSFMLKRPTRIKTNGFFDGTHNKRPFFAVLPHNFLKQLSMFNRDMNLTIELASKLIKNEASCIGLTKRIKVR